MKADNITMLEKAGSAFEIDGVMGVRYILWSGFFEDLQSVEVAKVVVK